MICGGVRLVALHFPYGFFWLAIALTWLIKLGFFGADVQVDIDPNMFGVAFVGYLIFTLFMTIGSLSTTKMLFIIFVLIDVLFIGLALSSFGIMPSFTIKLAAYSELLISLCSFYAAAGAVLNTHLKRQVIPLGAPIW